MTQDHELVEKIKNIAKTPFGSEDDLIIKVVLPFFELFGYGRNSYQIKFPVSSYRPSRPGRKPEADCVFFANSRKNIETSLLVVEVKRDDQFFPELQSRYYATNLFVPIYLAWSGLSFEIWQVQNFRKPLLIGQYDISQLNLLDVSALKELISPNRITSFCNENKIKPIDLNEQSYETEKKYITGLLKDLRSYKAIDLPFIFNLENQFVNLRIVESESFFQTSDEIKAKEIIHPNDLDELSFQNCQSFTLQNLLGRNTAIALIGDPGAGKTTLLRNLCIENCYEDSQWLPVFVEVKEMIAANKTPKEMVLQQIGRYGFTDNPEYLLNKTLSAGKLLLCLDGIDELDIEEPQSARTMIRNIGIQIKDILGPQLGNTIIISARRESWPVCRPLLPSFLKEFIVLPLTLSESRKFIYRWFSSAITKADTLIGILRNRGYPNFVANPLMLTLTCIVFIRRGKLPSKVSSLYEYFIEMMLEDWHTTRRISRHPIIPNLSTEKLISLLSLVALEFHKKHRASFTRAEIVTEFENHLPSINFSPVDPNHLFEELTIQHGIIRSWSIDEHYAFPHLSFQAFLTAKALRNQTDAHLTLTKLKDDAFWKEAIYFYAELGDITMLAKELLETQENILYSSLFMITDCWAKGGTIKDKNLRRKILDQIQTLENGQVKFLSDKAINALGQIDHSETKEMLKKIIHPKKEGVRPKSLAKKYAVKVYGEKEIQTITEELVKFGSDDDLLTNFEWLPRKQAIEKLEALILRSDWPKEEELGYDPGIRHIRRRAALLLAKIGEDAAIPSLKKILKTKQLTGFEMAGVVTAMASIDDSTVSSILQNILSNHFYTDCRIEAARHLSPHDLKAKNYLLSLIENSKADYFDRRDAAGVLSLFNLIDADLKVLKILLIDSNPEFWGGPSFAAQTVATIGSDASRDLLKEAIDFWSSSKHPDAIKIKETIEKKLSVISDKGNLRAPLERALGPDYGNPIDWYLPEITLEYFRRTPKEAIGLFKKAFKSWDEKVVFGGSLVWSILAILPQIELKESLLKSTIDLAKRIPQDKLSWSVLNSIWQRKDLDDKLRRHFFKASS
jgi:hypothetical protein